MDESRARLLAQLVQLSATPVPASSERRFSRLAYGSAAASLVLGFGLLYFSVLRAGAHPVPHPDSLRERRVSSPRKISVRGKRLTASTRYRRAWPSAFLRTYQIENPRPRSYEVDYLITPALGGAEISAIFGRSRTRQGFGMPTSRMRSRLTFTSWFARESLISKSRNAISRRIGSRLIGSTSTRSIPSNITLHSVSTLRGKTSALRHSIVPRRLNAVVVGRSEPPAGSIVTAAALSMPMPGGIGSSNIAEPFASVLKISARTGFPAAGTNQSS